MKEVDDYDTIEGAARAAIDEERLAHVLEIAADGEPDDDAVIALREVAVDEITGVSLAGVRRARRRGADPTGTHIGDAADELDSCCERSRMARQLSGEPISFDIEWP